MFSFKDISDRCNIGGNGGRGERGGGGEDYVNSFNSVIYVNYDDVDCCRLFCFYIYLLFVFINIVVIFIRYQVLYLILDNHFSRMLTQ